KPGRPSCRRNRRPPPRPGPRARCRPHRLRPAYLPLSARTGPRWSPVGGSCYGAAMGFEAHPVTPARWPDLLELFDRPVVRTCFCMYYRKTGSSGTGPGGPNRRAMKALVDGGTVPGLIGYEDGVPVAWVSLGPREDYAKLRRSPIMKPVDDRPVWS